MDQERQTEQRFRLQNVPGKHSEVSSSKNGQESRSCYAVDD